MAKELLGWETINGANLARGEIGIRTMNGILSSGILS